MSDSIYIRTRSGFIFYFDAVFERGITLSGSPTRYAMESGAVASDHYTQEHNQFSLRGSVSAVKFARTSEGKISPEMFEKGIMALKRSGEFFTVSCSKYLDPFHNCLFTSVQLTQNETTGIHTVDFSMSITQVEQGTAGQVETTMIPAELFDDRLAEKQKTSNTATDPKPKEVSALQKTVNELGTNIGLNPIFTSPVE